MTTVQKNNTITKKQVQELLEKNQEKLGLSDKNLRKLIKSMRSHTISRQMRKIFYQECLKKIERNKTQIDGKFKHLSFEERISLEILHTAGFKNSFIAFNYSDICNFLKIKKIFEKFLFCHCFMLFI